MANNEEGISPFVGICVAINLLMGSGFLALPSVFQSTGVLLSFFILFGIGMFMFITCSWEGAAVLKARTMLGSKKVPEVYEATKLFCGRWTSCSYLSVLSLSLVGSVWAYAILFGQSLTSVIPIFGSELCANGDTTGSCQTRYLFFLCVLAVFSTPLALMDIKDQAWFQLFMSCMRLFLVCIMCISCLVAFSLGEMAHSFPESFQKPHPHHHSITTEVHWTANLLSCVSACVFALFLNSSVPIVSHALADKSQLYFVLGNALAASCVFYGILASIICLCFGSRIDNPTNLNWSGYQFPSAFTPDESSKWYGWVMGVARCVEYLVVLFPAMDVLSVYPLTTVVLSNNLLEALYDPQANPSSSAASHMHNHPISHPGGSPGHVQSHHRFRRITTLTLRILVNVIPIAGAAVTPNFLYVIDYVGGISVLICFVFPALLSFHYNVDRVDCPTKDATLNYLSVEQSDMYVLPNGVELVSTNSECDDNGRNEHQVLLTRSSVLPMSAVAAKVPIEASLGWFLGWLDHPTVKYSVLAIGTFLSVLIIVSGWWNPA